MDRNIFNRFVCLSFIVFAVGCLPVNQESKDKLRPVLSKHFNQDIVYKLLGPVIETISLPPIPKIARGPKSTNTSIYSVKLKSKEMSTREKFASDSEFIQELYLCIYFRRPSVEELSKWLNALAQGGSREGVYFGLVLDSEYLQKQDTPSVHSTPKSLSAFVHYYYKKYLDISISMESIESKNFYKVKSDMVAATLELLDRFAASAQDGQNNDYLRWFAVVSQDFAVKFPTFWSSNSENAKRRTQTDTKYYFQWGQTWGAYWMKSEMIIKINQLCNFLYNEL